jgi:hypothetical protein
LLVRVIVPEVPGAPRGGIASAFNSSNTALEPAAGREAPVEAGGRAALRFMDVFVAGAVMSAAGFGAERLTNLRQP